MLACNYSGYFECSFDQETQRGMETEKKILGKGLKKMSAYDYVVLYRKRREVFPVEQDTIDCEYQ